MACKVSSRWMVGCALWLAMLSGANLAVAETPTELRVRLESMTPAEREELQQKQKRFYELDPQEQERIKRLHRAICESSHEERLRQVSLRYSRWLGTLGPRQRAELLALPADQRIAKVKEIMQQQEAQKFRVLVASNLSTEDRKAINEWSAEFARSHREEILSALPDDTRQRIQRGDDPSRRQRMLIYSMSRHRDRPNMPRPSQEEIEQLVTRLSPEARARLQEAEDPSQRETLLLRWIGAAIFSRMAPQVSDEDLQKFFEKLDGPQRDRLERLSRSEMMRELRRLVYSDMFRNRHGSGGGQFNRRPPNGERGGPRLSPRGENGPLGGDRPPGGDRGENGDRPNRPPSGPLPPAENPPLPE